MPPIIVTATTANSSRWLILADCVVSFFLFRVFSFCTTEFVYKSEMLRNCGYNNHCFVIYPVLYVGVESLVFGNNDDASAIFLPAANRALKLLRRSFCATILAAHHLLLILVYFIILIIFSSSSCFFFFSRYTRIFEIIGCHSNGTSCNDKRAFHVR